MLKVASRSKIILSDEESDDELEIVEAVEKASEQAQIVEKPPKNSPNKEIPIENSPLNVRNVKKGGRLSKGKKVVAKKKEIKEEEEDEDDNMLPDDDDDGDDVLSKCETISSKLLDSLSKWILPFSDKSETGKKLQPLENCDSIKIATVDSSKGSDNSMITLELMNTISKVPLKNYQMVGVNWLKLLYSENINGVLADDMGLGKTAQIIAFLAWLKHSRDQEEQEENGEECPRTHLIVVPASTLANWDSEIKRFCPQLEVFVYHGNQSERFEQRYYVKQLILNRKCDVVLTTYSYFSGTQRDERVFLNIGVSTI